MITVEELKNCKNASDELIKAVKNRINEVCGNYDEHNHIEDDFGFDECDGTSYDVYLVEESSWDDQGKYQYQDITYQLVSYDKNVCGYVCDKSIVDRFNLFICLPVTRSGSYFSEYYYEYMKPTIQIAEIEYVPVKVIPAHDEVRFIDK